MHALIEKRANKFARDYGFDVSDAEKFELYTAAVYLHRYIKGDKEQIRSAVMGGGSDEGIDVAAVIVNNEVVTDPKEIEDRISTQPSNSAKVIFIQAKTSEGYDAKLISKFLHGVEAVAKYAMKPGSIKLPPQLVDIAKLLECIADNGKYFDDFRIPCELYYVTTSANDGQNVTNDLQISEALSRINELQVYNEHLTIRTQGYRQIDAKEKENRGPQKVQFNFEKSLAISGGDDADDPISYIGVISAKELMKLLCDESGLRPGIFDDNVRLHLGGKNSVNQRIYKTLESEQRSNFPFLNNGVTMIATRLEVHGNRMLASGYQIVNGGQTSNQIVQWADSLNESKRNDLLSSVWIPIKIIVSTNPEIRANVTVSTNLQSAISNADIQASSQIAKEVESYFDRSGSEGLRYERQRRGEGSPFARTRVFSTLELDRAVAATVFGDSNKAISDSKELQEENSYVWGDYPPELFYYAAWVTYRVERHIARTADHSVLRAAKYHIAMMASAIALPEFIINFEEEDGEKIQDSLTKMKSSLRKKLKAAPNNQERIDAAISISANETYDYFASTLQEEGGSLRKDHVRGLQHQKALLARVRDTGASL